MHFEVISQDEDPGTTKTVKGSNFGADEAHCMGRKHEVGITHHTLNFTSAYKVLPVHDFFP